MRIRKCIKLKERFASFVFALLIFSASWLPFCISTASATTAVTEMQPYVCDITPFMSGTSDLGWLSFPVPSNNAYKLYATDLTTTMNTSYLGFSFSSNVFEPKEYDRTFVFTFSPYLISGNGSIDFSWNGGSTADLKYQTSTTDANQNLVLENGVTVTGAVRDEFWSSRSAPYMFFVTVPAYTLQFRFDARNTNVWQFIGSGPVTYNFQCYGAFVLNTANTDIITLLQNILANTQDITTNTNNINTALASVVNQLIALNADTDAIITMLSSLEDLSSKQLAELKRISFNTDAIYALLVDALADEAEEFDEGTQQLANNVQQSANSEARWQANMQGSYEELNISNTNFGNLNGSIVFVMQLFEDMLDTFGAWSILFTFPLTIGIALLVIGRISKSGGGNSSRNTEHKGGEGGA